MNPSDLILPTDCGDLLARVAQGLYFYGITFREASSQFEKRFIEVVLQECAGNKCAAARKLGMHRNTLDRYIDLLKIKDWEFNRPGTRRLLQKKQSHASKERSARGVQAAGSSALAPISAGTTQPYSVRKGGRGNRQSSSSGGCEVDTAHLAQSSKPPHGEKLPGLDVECGGLKA